MRSRRPDEKAQDLMYAPICWTSSRTTSVLESGETVFVIARHSRHISCGPAGLLRDSPVLSCARRVQRPSCPQVFDSLAAIGIKQLPYGLVREIRCLYSRSALTRRMSAVRSRQHPLSRSFGRSAAASLRFRRSCGVTRAPFLRTAGASRPGRETYRAGELVSAPEATRTSRHTLRSIAAVGRRSPRLHLSCTAPGLSICMAAFQTVFPGKK